MSQPPRVQFNFEPEEPVEDIEDVVEEDFSDNDEQSVEDEPLPDRVPEPVKREKPTDDIFEDIPSRIVADLESKISKAKPTKKTQKPKDPNKPKRKVNEEHMRKMREKAAETRARKKREKEEQQKLDAEEKELMSRKKKKDLEKIKRELDEEDKPKPAPVPAPSPARQMFTQEDLAKAQFQAIASYEVLRKERKLKKREAQRLEREKQELVDKLMGKTKPVPGSRYASDFFQNCY